MSQYVIGGRLYGASELYHGLGVGSGRGRPKGSRNGYISPGAAYMKNYQIVGEKAQAVPDGGLKEPSPLKPRAEKVRQAVSTGRQAIATPNGGLRSPQTPRLGATNSDTRDAGSIRKDLRTDASQERSWWEQGMDWVNNNVLKPASDWFTQNVEPVARGVISRVGQVASSVVNTVVNTVGTAAKAVKDTFEGIGRSVATTIGDFTRGVSEGYANRGQSDAEHYGGNSRDRANGVKPNLSTAERFGNAIGGAARWISDAASRVFSVTTDVATRAVTFVGSAVNKAQEWVTTTWGDFSRGVAEGYENHGQSDAEHYGGNSRDRANGVTPNLSTAERIGNAIGGAGRAITDAPGNAWNAVSGAAKDLGNWVDTTGRNIGNWVDTTGRNFTGGVAEGYNGLQRAGGSPDDARMPGVPTKASAPVDPMWQFGNAIGQFGKGVVNLPGNAANLATNTWNDVSGAAGDLGQWVGNTAGNVGQWVGNAANDVGDWIGDTADAFGNYWNANVAAPFSNIPAVQWANQQVNNARFKANGWDNYVQAAGGNPGLASQALDAYLNAVPDPTQRTRQNALQFIQTFIRSR